MMRPLLFSLFSFCFLSLSGAINSDSLKKIISESRSDTQLASGYNALGWIYRNNHPDSALMFIEKGLQFAKSSASKFHLAKAYNNRGVVYKNMGEYSKAAEDLQRAGLLFMELGDRVQLALCQNNLGNILYYKGEFLKALDIFLSSLSILEKVPEKKKDLSSVLANLANVQFRLGENQKAIDNYFRAAEIRKSLGDSIAVGMLLTNIGNVHSNTKEYEKSLSYHIQSLDYLKAKTHALSALTSMGNIGSTYHKMGQLDSAWYYYSRAESISKSNNNQGDLTAVYSNMAHLLHTRGDFEQALKYGLKSIEIGQRHGDKYNLQSTHEVLSKIYESKRDFPSALKHLKFSVLYLDSIRNDELTKKSLESQFKYEYGIKEEALKGELELIEQKALSEQNRQFIISVSLSVIVLLVVLFSLALFNRFKKIKSQNRVIEAQSKETERQSLIISEKNKDITDSINYAKRIQDALIQKREELKSLIPESFVFFKPRDIVSGDFYWFTRSEGITIVAVADCTGHGVPGAFMSIMGMNYLNELSVSTDPRQTGEILGRLREKIMGSLKLEDGTVASDGMDISLIAIDSGFQSLHFSGAHNPVWIFRGDEFYELKGDKQPVGYFHQDIKPFSSQTFQLNREDRIFLFSDGFEDQFGGPEGKKIKKSGFREILNSIPTQDFSGADQYLAQCLEKWKGRHEQVDDILVLGLKV
jgi:serine phosphatase RsbU (regulator of sigma subunit)/Tfp pilus assembly protein PilF